MEIETQMLKGYIDIIILGMLNDNDFYGYELAKQIKEKTKNKFEIKEGTLYLAFKRLEQNGLVSSYWGDENAGGRRKYYTITDMGKKHIKNLKIQWEQVKEIVDIFVKGV